MTGQAWARVFERYYDDQDMVNWEKAKAKFTPADQDGYRERWRALIGRVEEAMARGVALDAPEAMQLAAYWYALQQPLVEAVGAATWSKASRMYEEMDSWRGDGAEPPFSSPVWAEPWRRPWRPGSGRPCRRLRPSQRRRRAETAVRPRGRVGSQGRARALAWRPLHSFHNVKDRRSRRTGITPTPAEAPGPCDMLPLCSIKLIRSAAGASVRAAGAPGTRAGCGGPC